MLELWHPQDNNAQVLEFCVCSSNRTGDRKNYGSIPSEHGLQQSAADQGMLVRSLDDSQENSKTPNKSWIAATILAATPLRQRISMTFAPQSQTLNSICTRSMAVSGASWKVGTSRETHAQEKLVDVPAPGVLRSNYPRGKLLT